jgi:hypothetical protein
MTFPIGNLDDKQLAVLQHVFDRICAELGLSTVDEDGRNHVAHSLMTMAKVGELDPEHLRLLAITRFRSNPLGELPRSLR